MQLFKGLTVTSSVQTQSFPVETLKRKFQVLLTPEHHNPHKVPPVCIFSMKMWSATLAVIYVCITIGLPTVNGWEAKARLTSFPSTSGILVNCTVVSKIGTTFLESVKLSIGHQTYVKIPEYSYGLTVVDVIHTFDNTFIKKDDRARCHLTLIPGYPRPSFCWEPVEAIIDELTEAVKIGHQHRLTCKTLTNGTFTTYKWYKSPGPANQVYHIGRQLKIPASNIHEAGAYSCEAENECGKTRRSPEIQVYIEVPFLVEKKATPNAVMLDDLSYNITISGGYLRDATINMLDDVEKPTVQSQEIEGSFHYGQKTAMMYTMRWNVSVPDGNWTCYNTSQRLNGEYILSVWYKDSEKQVKFNVDMECGSKRATEIDEKNKTPRVPGTDWTIAIVVGIIVIVLLVILAGYFIDKRMTDARVDEINLIPGRTP